MIGRPPFGNNAPAIKTHSMLEPVPLIPAAATRPDDGARVTPSFEPNNAARVGPQESPDDLTDDELNAYILTRLKSLGVDLSVLPEDDEDAPADQLRILRSARRFLRRTPPDIHGFEMDPQFVAPAMYPSETSHRTRQGEP